MLVLDLVLGQAKSPSLAEDDSQSKACAMCLSRICMVGLPDLIVKSVKIRQDDKTASKKPVQSEDKPAETMQNHLFREIQF